MDYGLKEQLLNLIFFTEMITANTSKKKACSTSDRNYIALTSIFQYVKCNLCFCESANISCMSGKYIVCLASISCMSGKYILYVWQVYLVCLANISCMSGKYILYVWQIYLVCLANISCMSGKYILYVWLSENKLCHVSYLCRFTSRSRNKERT